MSSFSESEYRNLLAQLEKSKNLSALEVLSHTDRSLVVVVQDSKQVLSILKVASFDSRLKQEANCLKKLSHPHIVSFIDSFTFKDAIVLQIERVPGICLVELLVEGGKFSETEVSTILRQAVSALSYLHSRGWVHRDVKPDNMIYDQTTKSLKLVDFEFAARFSRWRKFQEQQIGTPHYLSPEGRKGRYSGPELDVWSLGVTIYVLLTAHFPFPPSDSNDSAIPPLIIPPSLSPQCQDLLAKMLEVRSEKRISMDQIQKHPFSTRCRFERASFCTTRGVSSPLGLTSSAFL